MGSISLDDLHRLVPGRFRDFINGVVDLRRGVLLLDADMLEFNSMINVRPSFGNRTRGIDDAATRDDIRALVESLVRR